jgi:ketosteroid isomerase-like protein
MHRKHRSPYLFIFTVLAFFITVSLRAQSKDEQLIRQLMAMQTEQWNRGNIEGFMKGYWKSDSLVFVGRTGPKYGYQTALENYKKGYPDTVAMGKLHFDVLKLQSMAPDCYFMLGKWTLKRSIGNLEGYFTLLFRKIKGEWVIVADHSS